MAGNTAEDDAIEDRRAKAWDLRVRGKTYREIGAALGVSGKTAHQDCHAVLDRIKTETDDKAEHHRELQLARLERLTAVLMPMAEGGDLDAMDRLDKLEKRRAALLGLDAPTRSELTGKDGAPVPIDARGSLIERLAGLVAGAASEGSTGQDPGKPDGSGS
jgi:hypothetical protein